MSEAENEEYLDYLYAEYLTKQEAYRYEDNPNNVREGGDG